MEKFVPQFKKNLAHSQKNARFAQRIFFLFRIIAVVACRYTVNCILWVGYFLGAEMFSQNDRPWCAFTEKTIRTFLLHSPTKQILLRQFIFLSKTVTPSRNKWIKKRQLHESHLNVHLYIFSSILFNLFSPCMSSALVYNQFKSIKHNLQVIINLTDLKWSLR